MDNIQKPIDLKLLSKVATDIRQFDSSVVYARVGPDFISTSSMGETSGIKIEGSVFFLLSKGKIRLSFNFIEYDIEAPAVISFPHGSVVGLAGEIEKPSEGYLLAYSQSFLQDVNISFSAISGEAIIDRKSPVMPLSDHDFPIFLRYFSLIESVLHDVFNAQLTRHILSSLTSALFYQTLMTLYKQIDLTRPEASDSVGPRRGNYVHDFIQLVHMHYAKERSVSFYAGKLFLSAKYLSLIVKEATGRSAASWIDHFVLMEAKNLLRYSGRNIQQIAFALNFSNQSSFGKYFKHLTGMSPTEYQKT